MSLSEIVREFNKYSEEFVNEMIKISNDADLKSYQTVLINLNKTNSTKCIEQFIIHGLPQKEKINNEDENYFLERNYADDFDNDDYSMMKALKIKDTWKTFDNNTKQCIFQYLQVMVHYSEEYFKLKYKTTACV